MDLSAKLQGGTVVYAKASQQQGYGFDQGPFWVEFAFSPCLCMSSLWDLWIPLKSKNMDVG